MRLAKGILVLAALAIGLSALAAGYALWSKTLVVEGTVNTGDVNMQFTHVECSDVLLGEIDLGNTKDVGSTQCMLIDTDGDGLGDILEINVQNAYPGYQVLANIVVTSTGSVPIHITRTALTYNSDPIALALEGFWTDSNLICTQLHQGDTISGTIWMQVKQEAQQDYTYHFQIEIEGQQYNEAVCEYKDLGGTIGFWKNWDSHKTYTQAAIEGWLQTINDNSDWLGPTTVAGMKTVFQQGTSGTMEQRFLAHYLATRLDAMSGRLGISNTHNIPADAQLYLGLPASPTLVEIFAAIESRYGTSPTNGQFEIMKDVCDALNNLIY